MHDTTPASDEIETLLAAAERARREAAEAMAKLAAITDRLEEVAAKLQEPTK